LGYEQGLEGTTVRDQNTLSTEVAKKVSLQELLQKLSSSEKGISASDVRKRLEE
jgi:hypothetical protein